MAYINIHGRLSEKPYENLEALFGLEEIVHRPPSPILMPPPFVPSERKWAKFSRLEVIKEPCFITKEPGFIKAQTYWIPMVENDDGRRRQVEEHIVSLGITGQTFDLNQQSNVSSLGLNIKPLFEKFACIAVTATLETLQQFSDMINADNSLRQSVYDTSGIDPGRRFDFAAPCFLNPEYELVALHPQHALPLRSELHIRDSETASTWKFYAPSSDQTLREIRGDPSCPRFPPFRSTSTRKPGLKVNPFFVILNAEIKFRRYLKLPPPKVPLPEDIQILIRRTIELVDLLYRKPTITPGTQSAVAANGHLALQNFYASRAKRPTPVDPAPRQQRYANPARAEVVPGDLLKRPVYLLREENRAPGRGPTWTRLV